jgi:hypothetical protein
MPDGVRLTRPKQEGREMSETKNSKARHWEFSPDRPYFVHDSEGDGFYYYATEDERDNYAKECIQGYLDDGWSEGVESVIAGKITHHATQVDREDRPENIDQDGVAEDGSYWDPDCDFKCNYSLLPINEQQTEEE